MLAWDTNLEKVFARYYHGRKDLKLSEKEKQIVQKDFQKWVSDSRKKSRKESVRALNNALMDFAAMIDLKNPNTIDWTHYPIKSGQFYETRGVLEPAESKRPLSFPTPDATVIVILHENHKIYYSPLKLHSSYSPCILPPALTRDTRQYVQGYFRARYRLELSVRPVHKKWISKEGQPYIAVNAQIQVGDASAFEKYEKSEAKLILDSL